MAFTVDREDWTAAQLNSVWTGILENLSPELPYHIRVNQSSGDKVDDLTISESDTEALSVYNPYSVVDALAQKASGLFLGSWNTFYDIEELKYKLEVRETLEQPENQDEVLFGRYGLPSLIAYVYLEVSGVTFSYSSDKFVTDTADGWSADNLSMQEIFDGEGFQEWDVGFGLIGLVEKFNDYDKDGYDYFDTGSGYLLTDVEKFNGDDWPSGVVPPTETGDYRTTDISSQVDGVKTTFTVPAYDTARPVNLRVYYNGQRLTTGNDVTILTSTTFSMTFAPSGGTELVVDYKPQ